MLNQLEVLKNRFQFFWYKTVFNEFIINILVCFTELQNVNLYQWSGVIWMVEGEQVISFCGKQ